MEVNKKSITLKAVLFKYLVTLGILFIVTLGMYMGIVSLCIQRGMIFPANYSEDLARRSKPMLASTPEITEDMIPYGCKFAVVNKQYEVAKTNLKGEELIEAIEYAKGVYPKDGSRKSYYLIERQDGFCVLQYYVKMRYKSEFFNQYLLSPENMLIISFVILFFFSIIITTTIYAKKLNKHLLPLLKATKEIKEQNLDFTVEHSKIKEFNDVILSISDMKIELKKSLEQQWKLEQSKKKQIAALAHDIKTPLTVIKGNAELLLDSALNNTQQEYTDYISKNTEQIEQYIKALIEISNSEKALSLQLERVDCGNFIDTIYNQLKALANTKSIEVKFTKAEIPKEITIDQSLLYRAIINVISNAVDYSTDKGKIYFEVKCLDNKIHFVITDRGKGFSKEGIKSATKQFFMGDQSRTSKVHYGLGLYITQSIIKLHGGTLHIANSPVTSGGEVTIKIPIKE